MHRCLSAFTNGLYKEENIPSNLKVQQTFKRPKKAYLKVSCLQTLDDLKSSCEHLGLRFVDCSDLTEENEIVPPAKKMKNSELYEVDMILDDKIEDKIRYYFVKWKSYSNEQNTWEPLKNLTNCSELIKYYKFIKDPPEYLRDKGVITYFIKDLVNRKPHDKLTLTKLCMVVYGSPEKYISELDLTFKQLRKKAIEVLQVPISKLNKKSKELFQLMQFAEARKFVLSSLKEWETQIDTLTATYTEVENNVDLEGPPLGFKFIKDYVSSYVDLTEEPIVFCSCTNCYENRDQCCSRDLEEQFAYNKYGRVKLLPGYPIYECNRKCKCGQDCINRVVQHGQKVKVTIFRTSNGTGWGLKTLEVIQKGQFVLEYLGEVITNEDAELRGEVYDFIGKTYLFDLDCGDTCLYTVDGGQMGNVSHFINHSCDPNLQVYTVWINQQDPNLPRLAFFARRKISRGEELTFDYKMVDSHERMGFSAPERVLCKCNASTCKKYLF